MAHNDWCGKPCAVCEHPCKLDESMPCSPDCDNLGPNGELRLDCVGCAAAYDLEIDGVVYILTGFFNSPETNDDCWIMGVYKTHLKAEETMLRYIHDDNRYERFSVSAHTIEDMARPSERLRVWFYDGEGNEED